jgi:uncharacterized membrane protein
VSGWEEIVKRLRLKPGWECAVLIVVFYTALAAVFATGIAYALVSLMISYFCELKDAARFVLFLFILFLLLYYFYTCFVLYDILYIIGQDEAGTSGKEKGELDAPTAFPSDEAEVSSVSS